MGVGEGEGFGLGEGVGLGLGLGFSAWIFSHLTLLILRSKALGRVFLTTLAPEALRQSGVDAQVNSLWGVSFVVAEAWGWTETYV